MTDTETRRLIAMWDNKKLTKKTIAGLLGCDMVTLRRAANTLGLPSVRCCGEGAGREERDPSPEEIEARKAEIVRTGRKDALPPKTANIRSYRYNPRTNSASAM